MQAEQTPIHPTEVLPEFINATSDSHGWNGLVAACHRMPPTQLFCPALTEHMVLLHLGTRQVRFKRDSFTKFGFLWRVKFTMDLSKKLLLSFCLCFGFVVAKAQYQFDQWTAGNGLPQNSVNSIVQTGDGYLWLATADGLVRFDGARFIVFNKSNSSGIVNNRFVALFEDKHGDLWAGTEEGGVVRRHRGRFMSYGLEEGLTSLKVGWISGGADGSVLVRLWNSEIFRWTGEKFELFAAQEGFAQNLIPKPSKNISIPCSDNQPEAEAKCNVHGRKFRFRFSERLRNVGLLNSVYDTDGTIWLTTNKGIVRIKNGNAVKIRPVPNGKPGNLFFVFPGERLGLIFKDGQNALRMTDLRTGQEELLTRNAPEALAGINCGIEDREGNYWLGTSRGGLFRLRKQIVTAYSKPEGLTENNVYPVYEDRHGVVWVGTTDGVFKYENENFKLVESSKNLNINAIGEDADGRLLVSNPGSVYVLEDGSFVPFYKSPGRGNYALFADRDRALWIGGGNGLVRLKDAAETVFTTEDGLAANDVKTIIEDRAGGLWIGSYGGLSHYRAGKFTSWTESRGLPNRTVRALHLDADGVLWIGSYDSGLARLKDGKFTHYDTGIGLYSDGAFHILEDARRNFWISSNRGIYRVSRDELNEFAEGKRSSITSVVYGKSDGMLNPECNGGRSPAGIKTRDGRLWFPTQDGVAVINPETVKINLQPPPVVIESVIIDKVVSSDLEFGNANSGFDKEKSAIPNPRSRIRIEPHQQNFEIQYAALSFINSENLRFKYRLEGLDDEWIDAGTRRTVYFSHVPAGEYTFRVIASNSDGVWNETGESLNVTVLPPFYRTWWFIALIVLTAFSVAHFTLKRRFVKLERERLAQQTFARQLIASQEAERKRIAAELHDSLGQRLVVIKNLALMFLNAKNGKADETGQIKEISAEASEAIGEVKAISYNLRPYQLDRIGLTKAVEAIVRAAQSASEIYWTAEIDDVDDYFPKEAEINFYRIVQECVSNAVKHSEASTAFVKIRRSSEILDFEISDDGRGFASPPPELKTGGFGLIGISERAALLGGKVEIKSAPEQGTVIKILIKQ